MKVIYLAGGCFWGTEQYISNIYGVVKTDVGYANGNTEEPTYEEVCNSDTGHAETVRVYYDPLKVSLKFLLDLYYDVIDPIAVNRQGGDVGIQYRTGIYYDDKSDEVMIKSSINKLQKKYEEAIAIEVLPLTHYYLAEEYHQKYLIKKPHGYCHIPRAKFEEVKYIRE
ncbi:MAG: peptide-methionine (S)-S-oxide reductase MsrA [Clostridiales bacterium]|nr:peptide-methionine (S)-S-oxide reductase MsrA [Clostridiales bacterium]